MNRFYKDAVHHRKVWTIKDAGGFPAPQGLGGKRAMPFWSDLASVEKVITTVAAYSEFVPHELTLEEFMDRWLPGLKKDGCEFF